MINKKTSIGILIIVAVQILLLINMTPAESYIIGRGNIQENNLVVKNDFGEAVKGLLGKSIGLLIAVIEIKQIGIVSAADATTAETLNNLKPYCCLKTKLGASCQLIASTDTTTCEEGKTIPTACEQTAECKRGCCVNSQKGTCMKFSTEESCTGGLSDEEKKDISWQENEKCTGVRGCTTGCCILGKSPIFANEIECRFLAIAQGIAPQFIGGENEAQCVARFYTKEKGACVITDSLVSTCKFLSQEECAAGKGQFKRGLLCTNEKLSTICKPTEKTMCLNDAVYFIDTCGNPANIYDADKINDKDYWGYIKTGSEVCTGSDTKKCGNCNRFGGSACYKYDSKIDGSNEPQIGDFVCRVLECKDAPANYVNGQPTKQTRKNGETWCLYDNTHVGEGKDSVGSEHFLMQCIDGKVSVQDHSNYRDKVCQETIINEGTAQQFTNAQLVMNEASLCTAYNSQYKGEELQTTCIANKHCWMTGAKLGDGFEFSLCAPRYPRGFDLGNSITNPEEYKSTQETNNAICKSVQITCPVVYVKGQQTLMGADLWTRTYNLGCETGDYNKQMNDLCVNMGDCGNYINYKGAYSGDSKIGSAGGPPKDFTNNYNTVDELNALFNYAEYSEGFNQLQQPPEGNDSVVEPQDYSEEAAEMSGNEPLEKFGSSNIENPGKSNIDYNALSIIGGIAGGVGGLLVGFKVGVEGAYAGTWLATYFSEAGTAVSAGKVASTAAGNVVAANTAGGAGQAQLGTSLFGGIAWIAVGAIIGGVTGALIAKSAGLGQDATYVAMGVGALEGAFIGYMIAYGWIPYYGWATALIAAAALIFISSYGFGKTKPRHITFQCKPWEPPKGVDDATCRKCNEDFESRMIPCTKYRCESLGTNCMIINEGQEENPKCIAKKNDAQSPFIRFIPESLDEKFTVDEKIGEGITITDEKTTTSDKKCISQYDKLDFKLNTTNTQNGKDVPEYAQCKWDVKTTANFDAMAYSTAENYYTDIHTFNISMQDLLATETYASALDGEDIRLYVRCEDIFGNPTPTEYAINFCMGMGEDLSAVNLGSDVTTFEPTSGHYLNYTENSLNLMMWINEQADCAWIKNNENALFSEMVSGGGIFTSGESAMRDSLKGFGLSTTLTDITPGENKFYIKCNDSVGNENRQAIEYDVYGSEGELKIDKIDFEYNNIVKPLELDAAIAKEKISANAEPIDITFNLATSGGAEKGKSTCSWGLNENKVDWIMKTTGTNVHSQKIPRVNGTHTIYFKCTDNALPTGNSAQNFVKLMVDVDKSFPIVQRAWVSSGKLNLITNEDAACQASTNETTLCGFDYNASDSLDITSGAFAKSHSTTWSKGKTYYIKCKDIFENVNSDCAIEVMPSMVDKIIK